MDEVVGVEDEKNTGEERANDLGEFEYRRCEEQKGNE